MITNSNHLNVVLIFKTLLKVIRYSWVPEGLLKKTENRPLAPQVLAPRLGSEFPGLYEIIIGTTPWYKFINIV